MSHSLNQVRLSISEIYNSIKYLIIYFYYLNEYKPQQKSDLNVTKWLEQRASAGYNRRYRIEEKNHAEKSNYRRNGIADFGLRLRRYSGRDY